MGKQKKTEVPSSAQQQHAMIGVGASPERDKFRRTTHPDAQWFPEAGLGLFVCWGISAVHGDIDLSWGMIADRPWDKRRQVTPEEYYALAERFRPDSFRPERWLRAAREAGFRYAVFTTKHHDGYTLWPSAYTDMGVQKYLPGVDLVGDFVEACRRCDLKVGLYYSPPDWHFNRQYMSYRYNSGKEGSTIAHYDRRHQEIAALPVKPPGWDEYFHAYIRGQTLELLTRYGKVDVLWFDGGDYPSISVEEIRSLQPSIVINPRMHGQGDFLTPECKMPDDQPTGWWELCDTWGYGSWGYTKRYEELRPNSWMLTDFAKVRGWGGNFLVNVAPRPDGEQPDSYYDRMREIAMWMNYGAEAVFGVERGSYPAVVNVPTTIKGDVWYLLVPPDFSEPLYVKTGGRKICDALLLRNGTRLSVATESDTARIDLPTAERSGLVDIVKVRWTKTTGE
jgi:alpha-L-fucosidase